MAKKIDITIGSGNVFADLGLPNPEERMTKVHLAVTIHRILERRKMTQAAVAKVLGINQPKVSALMSGKLTGFSVERLMGFLTKLRHDVVIQISPQRRSAGRVYVQGIQAAHKAAGRVAAKRA